LQLDDVPAGGEVRAIPRGVPGGAGGELVALQQQAIGPAELRQMIKRAAAHGAAADDHDPGVVRHLFSPVFTCSLLIIDSLQSPSPRPSPPFGGRGAFYWSLAYLPLARVSGRGRGPTRSGGRVRVLPSSLKPASPPE